MHDKIVQLHQQGLRNIDIARHLGIRKSSVTYHLDAKYYNRDYFITRQKTIKEQAVTYKGGHCMLCGYKKYQGALQFHHIDPTQKDPQFHGKAITRQGKSFDNIKPELDKCVLLCANCHAEVHGGLAHLT